MMPEDTALEAQKRLEFAKLAGEKTITASGGSNNYWLRNIINPDKTITTVETEDIIEFFDMNFSLGTVFKSLVRRCGLRDGLGKPGSTPVYETGKIAYYSVRSYATTSRRTGRAYLLSRLHTAIKTIISQNSVDIDYRREVSIPTPRRLPAYTFYIEDFINSFNRTDLEAEIFRLIFKIAILRMRYRSPMPEEYVLGKQLESLSERLNALEAAASTPTPSFTPKVVV